MHQFIWFTAIDVVCLGSTPALTSAAGRVLDDIQTHVDQPPLWTVIHQAVIFLNNQCFSRGQESQPQVPQHDSPLHTSGSFLQRLKTTANDNTSAFFRYLKVSSYHDFPFPFHIGLSSHISPFFSFLSFHISLFFLFPFYPFFDFPFFISFTLQ